MDTLDDFTSFSFSDGRWRKTVYRKGKGPAVILIHEMPGITPECVRLGNMLVDAGYTVFMPSLFGAPGKKATKLRFFGQYIHLCVASEFNLFRANRASPITDWLRALARKAFTEIGGKGVGAIGMCVSGNFALTMALDAHLLAPVVAQPGLPYSPTGGARDDIDVARSTLDVIRRRHGEDGLKVLGMRFEGDKICPRARFDTLERELPGIFERLNGDMGDGSKDIPNSRSATKDDHPHSVLTKELLDENGKPTHKALERVLGFFEERLR